MPETPFKRLILRAALGDVYPMVIRLVAVPDSLDLTDFDDIFHAVLGWDSGIASHSSFKVRSSTASGARPAPKNSATSDFIARRSFSTPLAHSTSGNGNSVWSIRRMVPKVMKHRCASVGGERPHRNIPEAQQDID